MKRGTKSLNPRIIRIAKPALPIQSQVQVDFGIRFEFRELHAWPENNIKALMRGIAEVVEVHNKVNP